MNLSSKLRQTAVRWAQSGVSDDGNTTYSAGAEITVRWENKRELFVNAKGEKVMSKAIIYSDADTTTIELDDMLYLGTLASLTAPEQANPNIVQQAYRVRGDNESRSLDASQGLGKVFL